MECQKEILSESFPIEKGVRQGCILSSILFNIYSEMLIKDALQDEDGIKINGESITTIRYADDTAILAEKEEDLQRMMDKIYQHCKNYGMNLNLKKTKTMVINKKDAENKVKVKIENEELEQVKEYTYLGSIEDRGRCIKEVKQRIGKAKTAF